MSTQTLKHGNPARLFPIVAESQKEQKTLAIVLSSMVSVRPFAGAILKQVDVRVGKRTTVRAFTEVTLTNEVKGLKDRPDAYLTVETGRSSWSALIEAKVGKQTVESDQLERYVELAKANSIDAVITITNELAPDPTIIPTPMLKQIPKGVTLFHLSWSAILTQAFLLVSAKDDPFQNDDEAFIVGELVRYLEHPNSGRLPMDAMSKEWPKIVADIQARHPIQPKSPDIQEMITSWHQEARDVALLMTRKLGEATTLSISRGELANPKGWVDEEAKRFCERNELEFQLDVPNAAGKIDIVADFLRRSISVRMKINAPMDRASNSAKLNWLLRQLSKSEKERVVILCITKGKGHNFGALADEIDPKSDEIKGLSDVASFRVEMSSDLGAKFNSRKKFIEGLEALVPEFYINVGQHLQSWVAPPPKIRKETIEPAQVEKSGARSSTSEEGALGNGSEIVDSPATDQVRPAWVQSWQWQEKSE